MKHENHAAFIMLVALTCRNTSQFLRQMHSSDLPPQVSHGEPANMKNEDVHNTVVNVM